MIGDRDIYECARLLIERHGEEAEVVVGLKLDAAFEADDVEEGAMWRLILAAMVQLRPTKPGADEPVN